MARIAYLDCFAGVAGDMLLAALLDAGWPLAELEATVAALDLGAVAVTVEQVRKQGLAARHLTVHAPGAQPLRHPADLLGIIDAADLPAPVRERAASVIDLLADVEARVHGIPRAEVHFHEVGAVDTLVDVVGVAAGLHALGVTQIVCAPLPWSQGTVQTAHGTLPVPPPAVAALLEGLPVVGVDVQGELITPTGAALVRILTDSFGPPPAMTVDTVGTGAGSKDWPERPNILRVVLGWAATDAALNRESLVVLAANIDDMTPEWYAPLMDRLFAAGALDVWLTPILMKKGRPAQRVDVLARPEDAEQLRGVLFRHSTTIGIRQMAVGRWALPRRVLTVETPYGPVQIKQVTLPDGSERAAPEHDDCAARAAEAGVPVQEVYRAALHAAGGS